MAAPRPFRFVFVKDGKVQSLFTKVGAVSPEGLVLDGQAIPLAAILAANTYGNRLAVTYVPADGAEPSFLVLQTRGMSAVELKSAIDLPLAELRASAHKAKLEAAGRADLYRVVPCPVCRAVIDASELPKTKYVFCRYCESLSHDGRVIADDAHRICPECDMYGRVRSYTEFYFYFILIAYGFRYQAKRLCDSCAYRLSWRVLLINLVFILGVVPALWMMVKSSIGRRPDLAQLAKANSLFRAGKKSEASASYARMHGQFGGHPGLYFNEQRYGDAVAACSTYWPASERLPPA